MSKAVLSQIPREIAEVLNLMAERYGYDLGRRVKESEKAKELRKAGYSELAETRRQIRNLQDAYILKGEDVRDKILTLKEKEKTLLEKLEPIRQRFNNIIRPLRRAVRVYDMVIPHRLEKVRGEAITPKTTVDEERITALLSTLPKKSKK